MKKILIVLLLLVVCIFIFFIIKFMQNTKLSLTSIVPQIAQPTNPLSIEFMRSDKYPGSEIKIEQTLSDGSNYHQYIASYLSEGLKIYGLLTIPIENPPEKKFPAIIFNHGYIPPEQYKTTERYVAYVDYFARSGYVVFKPDYRGNGNSEGQPLGAYYSPAYTIDVLNALASIKKYKYVNPEKLGMWGHSLGGNITLRSIVVNTSDVKAAVIWGGVVGSYYDLMYNWRRQTPFTPSQREQTSRGRQRQMFVEKYGSPSASSIFWRSIDPTYFVSDINTPIQLHAGLADETVPFEFSQSLKDKLKKSGNTVELFTYPGDDHNISQSFSIAMQRSLSFFDKYLKSN